MNVGREGKIPSPRHDKSDTFQSEKRGDESNTKELNKLAGQTFKQKGKRRSEGLSKLAEGKKVKPKVEKKSSPSSGETSKEKPWWLTGHKGIPVLKKFVEDDDQIEPQSKEDFKKGATSYEDADEIESKVEAKKDFKKGATSYEDADEIESKVEAKKDFKKGASSYEDADEIESKAGAKKDFKKGASSYEDADEIESKVEAKKDFKKGATSYEDADEIESKVEAKKDFKKGASSYEDADEIESNMRGRPPLKEEFEIFEISAKEKIPEDFEPVSKESDLSASLSDSLRMPALKYIEKKLQKQTLEELQKKGISASGKRVVLHVSGTHQFYVQNPAEWIGSGKNKRITGAELVNYGTKETETGHVIGQTKKLDEESKKEFNQEKHVANHLREALNSDVLADTILIPDAIKIDEKMGANAAKKVGKKLDDFAQELSLADRLGVASRLTSILPILHKAGVTHRDIKPDNILVLINDGGEPLRDKEGRLKFVISDLGTCIVREKPADTEAAAVPTDYVDPRFHTKEGTKLKKDRYPPEIDDYMLGLTLINHIAGISMNSFIRRQRNEANLENNDPLRRMKLNQWKSDVDKWSVWDTLYEKVKDESDDKTAQEVVALLKQTVQPNLKDRTPIEQVSEDFTRLYAKVKNADEGEKEK